MNKRNGILVLGCVSTGECAVGHCEGIIGRNNIEMRWVGE